MTSPSQTLRLVVVGAGHLGKVHARLATNLSNVELVGVVDPVRAVAESAAASLGTAAFTQLDQVLDRVDAAIIATPTVTHEQVAHAMIDRGIHVLIEKPLTDNVAGGRELVRAAQARGCVLQVGHVERFNPAIEVAQSHVCDPKFIEARRVGVHAFRSTDIGVVHDLMIHDIDLVLAMTASHPVDVQAFGVSVLGDSEDMAQATIWFENGCIANLVASRVSLHAERRLNVFTPNGFVGVDMQAGKVETVDIGDRLRNGFALSDVGLEDRVGLRAELFDGLMHHQNREIHQQNAILEEQRDFVRCIRESTTPRVDGRAGVAALVLAEQVLQSIATHQWDASAVGRIGPFGLSAQDILSDPRLVPTTGEKGVARRKAG